MTIDKEVEYSNITFRVEGDYNEYHPAHISCDAEKDYPAEGGDWEEYFIHLGENDITEFLNDRAIEAILEKVLHG
jgi:hypothetical protein